MSWYSELLVRPRVIPMLCCLCRMKQKEVYQVALYLGAGNDLLCSFTMMQYIMHTVMSR